MKYDFFISYSRKDTDIVDEFAKRFRAEGFHFWIDRDGVESGDAFKRVIVNAIKESALVLFFSSESSNSSPWTAKEISVAVHYGKPIIPIKIDKTVYNEEVEFDLVNLDYVDYTIPEMRQPMMEKLVRTIKSKLPQRLEDNLQNQNEEQSPQRPTSEGLHHQNVVDSPSPRTLPKKTENVEAVPHGPKKKKKTTWIVLGIVAVVALAVLVPMLLGQDDEISEEASTVSGDLTINANGVDFVMKLVEGEAFVMGGTDDNPAHDVSVSTFYMGETEVTQALWRAVMGSEPTHNGGWTAESGLGDNYPAYEISWREILTFIRKLNAQTGRNFRLPTEVEWEFAARGGKKANGYLFSGSPRVEEVAWYNKNSGNAAHNVKQLKPNELGLYDMSGNVWEWCSDLFDSNAQDATMRVLRGGGWNRNSDRCQVTFRGKGGPDFRGNSHGFRLALSL